MENCDVHHGAGRDFLPIDGLSDETCRLIVPMLVVREWPARALIFRASDRCEGLHIMTSGLVKLYRASRSGKEQIVHLLREPGPLSLTPLFDGDPYPAAAATISATRTVFIPRADFDALFRTRPDFAFAMARELARRVRATTSIAESISLQQVPSRVASRIVQDAQLSGALEDARMFRMTLNQEEMARLLGTSRESVARAMAELRRSGMIEQRGARIRILHPGPLMELAQSSVK